ncbi:inositol-1-monophosphatase [Psychrobium sp. 1_MG-2023]|uniref:inositol-1-monophosphatase n=1 Tax=Psychrobium sp. 1_MG-2023 TaxID=3062624 RepID=UPI000C322285|nr:inositol-1-monophosphatase [Psychrobium sp. 1_MG-2023]MDP2560560.1 inositol-1-monophosphatase [Psychrobium sp. 1_MG-2023]PKF57548.1 inositol-1-monophosphatase [Alteromonadales bacterium alter-6D02]
MHPMLNIAIRAARSAGKVIMHATEQLDKVEVQQKGTNDLVTTVDNDAEQAIIEVIKKAYPDHGFICEESGELGNRSSEYQWIVDPLDGTTNFIKGIPHFAVSIALQVNGKTEQAVVFDPIRDELFTATRGQGCQFNSYRTRVTKAKDLKGTVIATGFPFKVKHYKETYLAIFSDMFDDTADMRRAGSAALDLAHVAAGRLDGFWEIGLKPWDTAAGELLVKEAGGIVTDFTGGHGYVASGNIVVGNPKVVKAMLSKMRPHLTPALSR